MTRRPTPPRPDLTRSPGRAFGWLDARLLHGRWLEEIGAEATAVLTFLALAADRRGASFYGRDRMARAIALSRESLDRALDRLLELRLVEHRPWRPGDPDGVWQIMPLPETKSPLAAPRRDTREPASIRDILGGLRKPPDNRAS